jgi:hypothetical protein
VVTLLIKDRQESTGKEYAISRIVSYYSHPKDHLVAVLFDRHGLYSVCRSEEHFRMVNVSMGRALSVLTYVTIVNFSAAVCGSIYLGGDALNGYANAGKYFLSWHGKHTEVSKDVFNYSRMHMLSAFGLIVASMLLAAVVKPSPEDVKWHVRLALFLGLLTFVFATWKYGF